MINLQKSFQEPETESSAIVPGYRESLDAAVPKPRNRSSSSCSVQKHELVPYWIRETRNKLQNFYRRHRWKNVIWYIFSKAGQNVANFYQSFTSELSNFFCSQICHTSLRTFSYCISAFCHTFLEFFFRYHKGHYPGIASGWLLQYKKYYKPSNGKLVSVSLPSPTMHSCRCTQPSPVHTAQPRSDHAPGLRPQNWK